MDTIIITTAKNMSAETFDRICSGFQERYGKQVKFEHITDDGIIGGFIADVGGEIYDLSISSQLDKMKKQILV